MASAVFYHSSSATRTPPHVYFWDCPGVIMYVQPWRSYTGCPSCSEPNSRWHWWCSQSTHAATSPIQCRRVTAIRDGLYSARHPVLTILFHGQERNSAIEPSLWPDQLYGTVYRQQFVKQTACIRSSASSKLIFLPCDLLTNYVFIYFTNFCKAFPVRCRVGRA